MIAADAYLHELTQRLAADGCAVTNEQLGLVGYKAQWKALTRMHVFLIAAKSTGVNENTMHAFANDAVNLAVGRKGQMRGMQSGVIVLPVLIADGADQGAVAVTQRCMRLNVGGFAVMAQPALVDVVTGQSHIFRGTRYWGLIYNGMIKKKLALYLPNPAPARVA